METVVLSVAESKDLQLVPAICLSASASLRPSVSRVPHAIHHPDENISLRLTAGWD